MERHNILIVGLGSMGKRRARLMPHMDMAAELFGVDTRPDRRLEAEEQGIHAFDTLESALAASQAHPYTAAFVCTAPLSHAAITNTLLDAGIPVFSELNLVPDGHGQLVEKAADKKLPLFLSSTMLYRRETQYIQESVAAFAKPVSYVYHIGQYLPDWHPWENYRDYFVGDRRSGGVREILAVELPWLICAFGEIDSVRAHCHTVSDLGLPYPDSCAALLCHKGGAVGMLAADVVSPKAVRNMEVYGEGLHLFWEGRPDSLYRYDTEAKEKFPINSYGGLIQNKLYSDNVVENAYIEEMRNFFDVLKGLDRPRWSFERDAGVLEMISGMGVDGAE